jgi:hypothetical protein
VSGLGRALAVWAAASAAGVLLAASHPLYGLAVAALGGALFGALSARRVDARRVLVRMRAPEGRGHEPDGA